MAASTTAQIREGQIREGLPYPLGATWDGKGVNFALFSAQRDQGRALPVRRDRTNARPRASSCPNTPTRSCTAMCRTSARARSTAIACTAPTSPTAGHRFNPNKLLLDPYARGAFRRAEMGPGGVRLPDGDAATTSPSTSATARRSCRNASSSIPNFDWQGEPRRAARAVGPARSSTRRIVRGFTKLHPDSAEEAARHLRGLGRTQVIDYIKSLGVTSVELLPIHTFINDSHLLDKGPDQLLGLQHHRLLRARPALRRTSAEQTLREFKEMVARFHDAGLEVILDVVYNHTAEGNELGPTLSFKGIDNATYYRLLPDKPRYYINDTGTGNTLNLSHPRVIQMVTDSLRYWVERDACRRLPLRSRHHPGARARRLRQSERLSEGRAARTRCCAPSS